MAPPKLVTVTPFQISHERGLLPASSGKPSPAGAGPPIESEFLIAVDGGFSKLALEITWAAIQFRSFVTKAVTTLGNGMYDTLPGLNPSFLSTWRLECSQCPLSRARPTLLVLPM